MPLPPRPWFQHAVYDALLWALLPIALLRLLWRSRDEADYRRRMAERLGWRLPPSAGVAVWIHAVSVGELLAALPLVEAMRGEHPREDILVTTTTPAASKLLRERLGGAVLHAWAPWDLPGVVRRFLRHFAPRRAIVMDTELWPNQVAACAARGIPLVVANARLSARSAARYARFPALTRAMMGRVQRVLAQTEADAARFRELGVPAARVAVTGSLKWNVLPAAGARERAAGLRAAWSAAGERAVWIAASTHAGEEEVLLAALRLLRPRHPRLLLVLVPRHAARAPQVLALARRAGFAAASWQTAESRAGTAEVLVVDAVGELAQCCGAADLAFVGGSLVPHGGHNLAEPAAWGLPLLSGPSLFNFEDMAARFSAAGALTVARDAASLADAVDDLLGDGERRALAGAAARRVVETNCGAVDRVLDELRQLWS